MDRLIKRVRDLPRETFDQIQDLVFTPTQSVVMIDEAYKPPSSLHVAKATRRQYGWKYYSGVVQFRCTDPALLCKYLSSLTKVYRSIMYSITLLAAIPIGPIDEASYARVARIRSTPPAPFNRRSPLEEAIGSTTAQAQTHL